MVAPIQQRGVLRVVSGSDLDAALQREAKAKAQAEDAVSAMTDEQMSSLAGHIRSRFEMFRNHRNNGQSGWSERMLQALRAFNGQYEPSKLQEIRKFGGSEVYARIIGMKCRGASSLLRDVYLNAERPWGLSPPSDPSIPAQIAASIQQLVAAESQMLLQAGQPVDVTAIRDRTMQLMEAARQAAKKRASDQSEVAEDKIEEMLQQGGFYKAFAEFIVDLPLFPFAALKGPVVRIVPTVTWEGNQANITQKPRLFWNRVSPFDIWWTPGVSDIEDAEVIEKTRVTRGELNDLLDLPGYNTKEVRAVLDEYGRGGIQENWDTTDAERAMLESRENPVMNRSGLLTCLEYHGNVQGRTLLEYGFDKKQVPDDMRDYFIQAWLIGNHVIKAQLSPSPRRRHPYFLTSYEKVPGTVVGNGLPDIIGDHQEVCNASLRAIVNNLSIASGPQVVINDDCVAPSEDSDELYPWKRWHVTTGMNNNSAQQPVYFFQPQSNVEQLLGVYQKYSDIADEVSAIPKYLAGGGASSGAGRTASGLAMLMGNASKILQTVAANIDRDVLDPLLSQLFDMLMLTDQSGMLTGEEEINVKGVAVAVQRETQRSRQIEFLQLTANPIDSQIMGVPGRAKVLRAVSKNLGLPEEVVPPDDQLASQAGGGANPALAQAGAQAQGDQPGETSTNDMGPRTNLQQRVSGGVH